jgi:hypothetical protein
MPLKGQRNLSLIGKDRLEENRRTAKAQGRELDRLGRLRSGPAALNGEWEVQTHTDEDGKVTHVKRRVPIEVNRCIAKIVGKENPWRGNRCTKVHNRGAKVCKVHGGSLPNVKKAAARRLAMAADPAAAELINIALKKPGVADADRIRAIIAILDRAGIAGKSTIEIELKPWQNILQKVYGNLVEDDGAVIELEEGVDYVIEDEDG